MTRILIAVLNMSMVAGIVATAVILVRVPLKKVPKIFSYSLWAVVLLRLICPFSLESPASLMPTNIEIISPTIITTSMPLNDNVTPPTIPVISMNPIQIALSICAYLWLCGIVALLLNAVMGYFRMKHQVYDATLVHDNIFETDKVSTAFVLGFICPKIYIPTGVKGKQLDYILKHEQVHIRRRDYLIKPLAFIVLAVHWFNPIIWISYFLMSKDMEMSCDEAVLLKSSEDIRQAYSVSLVNLYAHKPGLLSPLAFGEDSFRNIKERIKNVLNFKKTPRWAIVICSFLLVMFTVGFTTNPPQTLSVNNLVNTPNVLDGDNAMEVDLESRVTITQQAEKDDIQNFSDSEQFIVDKIGDGDSDGEIAIFNSENQQIHIATILNLSSIPEFSKKNQGYVELNMFNNTMFVSIKKCTDEPDDSPDGFNVRYKIDCNSWTLSEKEYWTNPKYVGNVENEVTDQRLIEIAAELKERLYQTE